jgi:alpha-galactosidase
MVQDVGYQYVNLDDCWSVMSGRDNVTNQIIPDPVKFPNGISGLADQVHALGLKIGIYSSAGTETCADYPASIGYESIDAATFAGWGIDCKYWRSHYY